MLQDGMHASMKILQSVTPQWQGSWQILKLSPPQRPELPRISLCHVSDPDALGNPTSLADQFPSVLKVRPAVVDGLKDRDSIFHELLCFFLA